jgi:RNA polymerase sigma-70 factor (ECF subfamily)
VDERAAIERLKRGEIAALEPLVRAHQLRAVRAAYLVTRDLALADDVVQSAFVRAYERIGGFDPARPFGPWFMRVVLNDAVKAATRRRRESSLDDQPAAEAVADLPDAELGPEASQVRRETAAEVWAALGELPPAQRAAVVQRYYLGLSEAEMSAVSACPPSTVKWRLHAARERLRALLAPIFEPKSSRTES